MPAITVSRQYGAGGSDVAKLLGAKLGWTVIDNEFVNLVAQRAGLPIKEVERLQERVSGLLERLAQALALASPEVLVVTGETPTTGPTPEAEILQITEAVIREAVKHDSVVLVGRGAQAYLGARDNVLHVYLVAPLDLRVSRAAHRLKLDPKDAARAVTDYDTGRRQYVKTHYGRVWDDPANYDLVLNSGRLPLEEIADLVVDAVKWRGWT